MTAGQKYIGRGMVLGVAVGAVISALTGDWAVWVPVGLATGLAVGAGLTAKARK